MRTEIGKRNKDTATCVCVCILYKLAYTRHVSPGLTLLKRDNNGRGNITDSEYHSD